MKGGSFNLRRQAGVIAIVAAAFCFSPSLSGGTPVPGEFLLKFASPVAPSSWWHDAHGYLMTGIPSIDTLNVQYEVTDMIGIFYPLSTDPEILADQEEVGLDRVFKAIMNPAFDPVVVAADYHADPETEYAEANDVNEGDQLHQYTPNDTLFYRQWSLDNTGQTGGTPDADIDAPEAWMIQRGDSNVVIAIVDMGVSYNLPDLKPNIWVNPGEDLDHDGVVMDPDDDDDIDNDGNGKVDDFIGWDCVDEDSYPSGDEHGTWVAHVLDAVTDNTTLMASTASNCKLMVVRAGSGTGSGSLEFDDCAEAIEYAARNGADVINMSWSNNGTVESWAIMDACIFAYKRDCVLVASAGNNFSTAPRAPAHWESGQVDVIAVAGTDHNDNKYAASNYGSWIDVCAPSKDIVTVRPDGQWTTKTGTSFGAPIVSGIAALIRSACPTLRNWQVIDQIESTCDDIGLSGMGYGRVNAHSALQLNVRGWNPDVEVSTHGPDLQSSSADVAAVGDTVYAVWTEAPSLPVGVPEVYYARSTDNGDTWSAPIMLSTDDGISSTVPAVAAEGSEVYVVWTDGRWGANTDISFRYSSDYGETFGPEKNATQTAATAGSDGPDIAVAGGVAHLAWVEHGPLDNDCYYRALEDGARRNGLYLVSGNITGTNAVMARVDADGKYVQVVWQQDSGGTQIMHRRNTSKGDSTSWSNASTLRSAAVGTVGNPDVAAAGRNVYALWDEDVGSYREIKLRKNIMNGKPWSWRGTQDITPGDDNMNAREARIAAYGQGIDIVWSTYNGFNFEIYNSYSVDNGTTFSRPLRVTFNGGYSGNPSVECLPGWSAYQVNYVYVVWPDDSHDPGSARVRFKRREPRTAGLVDVSDSWDFDHHDLSGWGGAESGGNSISISSGPSVSAPNALFMYSQNPGVAWVETPPCSLDLDRPHWLTTWLYLDGLSNDGVIVMNNQEVRLEIAGGGDLLSGTGLLIETLAPYTWYLVECYATPDDGTYDVFLNEEYKATVPFEPGPPSLTIVLGDVIDGPAGYGAVRWDDLGYGGLALTAVGDLPPPGRRRYLDVRAYPNPFRRGVNIDFTLPASAGSEGAGGAVRGGVTVSVFDAEGRLVRSMRTAAHPGARSVVHWDGRGTDGEALPAGTYFIYVETESGAGASKVVLLR